MRAAACLIAAILTLPFGAGTTQAQAAPTVTGVAITSDPGTDGTYTGNDTIEATLTFSEAVTVDTSGGTPTLGLRIHRLHQDSNIKSMTYDRGTGTDKLVFAYTVLTQNSSDAQGVTVVANTLALNSGTIKSTAGSVDATLTHSAEGPDADHVVVAGTSSDTTAPTVHATTAPTVNGTSLTITFSETLDTGTDHVPAPEAFTVTVTPSGETTGTRRNVASGGVSISGAVVTLTLESAVLDTDTTVKVRYTRPASKALQDTNGNAVATFADQAVTNNSPTSPPTVASASVQGKTLTLNFTKNLDTGSVPEASAFTVTVGVTAATLAATNPVSISGKTLTLTLASRRDAGAVQVTYTVPATGNKLRQSGGSPDVAAFTNQAVTLLPATPVSAVTGTTMVPQSGGTFQTIQTIRFTFTEDISNSFNCGEVCKHYFQVALTDRPGQHTFVFRTAIEETGQVLMGQFVSSPEVTAPKMRGGETIEVTYAYIPPTDRVINDPDSHRIRDVNNLIVNEFSSFNVTNTIPIPAVDAVALTSTPSVDADTYEQGDEIRVTLTFDEAMTVTGAPRLKLGLGGGAERWADYESGSGSSMLTFRYEVQYSETSAQGVRVPANTLQLNGGTIISKFSTTPANLAHAALAADPNHKVNGGVDPNAPPPPPPPPPRGGGGPPDTAPDFGGARVAALVLVRGEAMVPVTLPKATGGNGAIAYSLTSVPSGLAGLSFDASSRRLSGTPDAAGDYAFTYTAHDADTNRADLDAAVLTFSVTVEESVTALVRQSVRRTLSAVARRSLTSALDNIGARFAASVPASGLTLAGKNVRFGADGESGDGEPACTPDAFAADGEGCAPSVQDIAESELLGSSAFSRTLGADGETGASETPLWAVWGRGDLGSFAGRPEPGTSYDGGLRTGWLGVDARAGPWVAGIALSHGEGEVEYSFRDGGASGHGRLETTLTALHPYGRWTAPDGLELRGVLGAGRGEARHWPDGGERETSDLSMWMGSLGVGRPLPAIAGFDLAARADASVARMETADGPDHVHGLTANSWRLRAGVEASRRITLGEDASLTPFVEAAVRRDGGDGLAGSGVEIAGGLRYMAPRLLVEARGRWLAAHSEAGAEERGVSVTARFGPGAHGRGLSLSLSPRWGADTGGAEALWRDELPQPAGLSTKEAAAMDASVSYGHRLGPHGMLTPFAETGLAGADSRRLAFGTRFESSRTDLGVELAAERRENGAADPRNLVRLDFGLRF